MIIGNGPVITNDPANPFVADGAVVIDGDTIVAVGPAAECARHLPGEEFVDVGGPGHHAGPDQCAHPCLQRTTPAAWA